ncbi:MAG: phosphomannomutase/phosphoglucomutase [Candidatus Pacebacteria bacterium]|nr:phosphomannomutase/phosphoglucomutase [Candidatus Paceibacterota bacterium]
MKINPKIFRAYDIRGVYPKEINKNVAYFVGKAFCLFLKEHYRISSPKIVVGYDARVSSPTLYKGIKQGICGAGGKILDLGFCSTPLNYFAIWHKKADGGVMITASHNPKEYNGFKLSLRKVRALSTQQGTEIIYKKILRLKKTGLKQEKIEKIEKINILDDYFSFLEKKIKEKGFSSQKLIVDFSNGSTGPIFKEFSKKFKINYKALFEKPDGNFPNHDPNPFKEGNQKFIKRYLKRGRFDMGVMFDGDGDRICFLDEKGNFIRADYILALLAIFYLKFSKSKYVVCDLRASRGIKEAIERVGGKLIKSRVGYPFIKKEMEKYKAFLGGELSGHYFWKEASFSEASLLTLLCLMKVLKFSKKPLSSLVASIAKYESSKEINFEVEDKIGKIEKLKKIYKDGKISELDGLTVEYRDWWFNVRPSNTEPVLRLTVEANTKELLEKKVKELKKAIEGLVD